MSYQVIARKYRPQTFNDLTGQEHISRTLGHALDQKRLHHAYLFSGVRGTGKTTTARILAKGLNCHAGITSQPCLRCPACLEVASGASLDVLEIDAASNTGVDNVRDVIINNIAMAPARDRYKVFVIDEVHMLSTNAFNALLKTLEEPPAHVVFIMATTELHKVPDTILSRCQQFEFRQIPTEKIFGRLREIAEAEGVNISDGALREIARAGAGSLRDAQSAFDQVIAFSGNQISEDDVTTALGLVGAAMLGRIAEAIARQNTAEILSLVEEISVRGYDLRNLTQGLNGYFRNLLLVKSSITDSDMLGVTDVEVDRLKQLSSLFSEEDLVRCFHLLAQTEKEIKDSPHPRFQLEIGLVKLTHATKLRSLEELINRLEDLESRLNPAPGGGGSEYARSQAKKDAEGPNQGFSGSGKPGKFSMESRGNGAETATELARPGASAPPIKPISVQPAAPVTATGGVGEPPDFPDFDITTEPGDFLEQEFIQTPRTHRNTGQATERTAQKAPSAEAHSQQSAVSVPAGQEVEVILKEIQKMNRGLVHAALEDAQSLEFRDGALIVTFGKEDMFVKRLRDSGQLFRDLGARLFGKPISLEVMISGQIEERVDEAEARRRQLRDRAMQSPAVRLIVEKTKAEVLWVREKEDPSTPTR